MLFSASEQSEFANKVHTIRFHLGYRLQYLGFLLVVWIAWLWHYLPRRNDNPVCDHVVQLAGWESELRPK